MHPLSKVDKSYWGSKADNENPVADTRLAASLESLLLDWAILSSASLLFCSARFPPAPGVSNIQHSPRGFFSEVRALKVDRLLNTQTPRSWALPRSSSVPCSRLTCPVAPQLPLLNQRVSMPTSGRKILPIPHFPFTGKRLATVQLALVGSRCYDRRNEKKRLVCPSQFQVFQSFVAVAAWSRSSYVIANQEAEGARLGPKTDIAFKAHHERDHTQKVSQPPGKASPLKTEQACGEHVIVLP